MREPIRDIAQRWDSREARAEAARQAREFRRVFMSCATSETRASRASEVRYYVRRAFRAAMRSPKFSPESLRRYAERLMEFAESEWPSHDTEYYSACGWDDYQADRRHYARQEAHEARRVAAFLDRIGRGLAAPLT